MQNLKIKLIQTVQHWQDKEANFKHFQDQFFDQIKPGEQNLILFPEMFNTGFSMNTSALAEKMDGPSILWMIDWARKFQSFIGASLIIEENGSYFNRFVIVSKDGVETTYDKRHLFRMANEQDHFQPGEKRVILKLKGWRILLQVCYDLRFPVFSRNRSVDGEKEYDALIYIANWPKKRAFIWKNLVQARAIENQAYCIGLNRVGEDGNGIAYSGDSMAVDPWGNIINQAQPNQESITTVTLEKKVLDNIKTSFPAYLDADHFSVID